MGDWLATGMRGRAPKTFRKNHDVLEPLLAVIGAVRLSTYNVRFEGAALIQLNGMPAAAFDALVERVVELVDAPWDASVLPLGDDPAYRMTVFGAG